MKAYTITVNGVAYDVTVEERAAGAAPVAPAPVVMAAPVAPAPAPVAPAGTRTGGSTGSGTGQRPHRLLWQPAESR